MKKFTNGQQLTSFHVVFYNPISIKSFTSFITTILIIQFISCVDYGASQAGKVSLGEGSTWSACSTSCGPGIQVLDNICLIRDMYGLKSQTSDEKCKKLLKTGKGVQMRPCNLGKCEGYYFWKEGEWSPCSQTCGSLGYRTREMQCLQESSSGTTRPVGFEFCDQANRPLFRQKCNNFDCPPIFRPGDWGKCPKPKKACEATRRTRRLECGATLANGTMRSLPNAACYVGGKRPPVTWELCYDYVDVEECVGRKKVKPIILEKKALTIQMRRTEVMELQVGQDAYLLPGTKVSVTCPVHYYVPRFVKWSSMDAPTGKARLSYEGNAKKKRVKVDSSGSLNFERFSLQDSGVWICHAGESQAMVTLKIRSPSSGYADWVYRNSLWSEEMMHEAPKETISRRDVVQWVTQPWSPCSVTCGGQGVQTRKVQCEKVETHSYTVLNDSDCINDGLPKPRVSHECSVMNACPQWQLISSGQDNCTDQCIDVGLGVASGNITCTIGGKVVSDAECKNLERPNLSCNNSKCAVKWKNSPWSSCSISCSDNGELGRRSRYLACVWQHNGSPAGFTCYRNNLPIPPVVEKCVVPKCKLQCLDLLAQCGQNQHLCRHSSFRSQCCATCTSLPKSVDSNVQTVMSKRKKSNS